MNAKKFGVVLLLLGGWAFAQTWYYNIDQDNAFSPSVLEFNPTVEQLMCAALLESGSVPQGGVVVDNLILPPSCATTPPVVVYGVDPDTGDAVYAALLTAKFWGRKRYWDDTYGVDPLIDTLQQYYALQVSVNGDYTLADAQFSPPWTTPPIDQPVSAASWYRWQASQTIRLGEPEVRNEQNYGRRRCEQMGIYFKEDGEIIYDRCWSAELVWALPVRLVVHGDELGSATLTLTPGIFERRSATTLRLQGGEPVEMRVEPYPYGR